MALSNQPRALLATGASQTTRGMRTLRAGFAAVVAAAAVMVAVTRFFDVALYDAPAWLGLIIVSAVGIAATFTVRYWRIRPIAPGRITVYATTTMFRLAVALLPAMAGVVMHLVTGSWELHLAGSLWAVPGLMSAVPSDADYRRHQDLWNEILPMPADEVWGTANPDAIAPWEDPEGGHGHGIGHHGLH